METAPGTISASRVPALLGVDKRMSPLSLYLSLRGEVPDRDLSHDEAVREGVFYERATAEIICAKYGMTLVDGFEQKLMVAGNLSGHPDFLAIDEEGKLVILEVKNPFWSYAGGESDDDWGEPGTDEVPRAYLIQAMVYTHLFREWIKGAHMDVTWDEVESGPIGQIFKEIDQPRPAADYAYVVAKLRGGVERFKIPYDPEIIRVVENEVAMMLTRVQLGDAPDPRDEADQRKRWLADPAKRAECNLAFMGVIDQLRKQKVVRNKADKAISDFKMQILALMKDAGVLEFVDHATGERREILTAKPERSFDAEACWREHSQLLIEKGYATVNTTKLRNEQKALYENFMVKPETAAEQTRTIRLKDKAIDAILGFGGIFDEGGA